MVLPAFASIDDLIDRGVKIGVDDGSRAQAALDDVSALMRSVAGKDWVTPPAVVLDTGLPGVLLTVCCTAARRAYENPSNIRSAVIDGYSDTRGGDVFGGVDLTATERRLVEQAAGSVSPGLWTISTTRGTLETAGFNDDLPDFYPVLVDTVGGEPIAWLDPSELPPT